MLDMHTVDVSLYNTVMSCTATAAAAVAAAETVGLPDVQYRAKRKIMLSDSPL